jgi:hypothetical protein
MHKLVDCVIEEIVNFIKENRIKFIKIKNAKNRNGKPKSQYKCEDWMKTELYFRFCDIFHTVEPEPKLSSGKRFDFFIKNDEESLWIEAKERFNGGKNNKKYNNNNDLIKAINEFIEDNECKELLFFSTYDEPIDEIIKNNLEEKLKKEFDEKLKSKEKTILLEPRGEEIKLCNTETLYLHFYIITKL